METSIALGTFDGVHIGHRAVLESAAKHNNSIALAFSLPPKSFFSSDGIVITDKQRKAELIKQIGIKKTVFLDFADVKDISATSFFEEVVKKYNPEYIYCGENYTFGKNASGNVELLAELCEKKGIKLNVCNSVLNDGVIVSSSYIRNLLKAGNIKKANELLSSDFSFSAKVIHGDKRGRTIGFPTINQKYPKNCAEVKRGVYKSYIFFENKKYDCISNIGIRPTYESNTVLCETYIKDFNSYLYGKNMRIFLKEFIREEKKFGGLDELKKAIENDLSFIK